MQPDDGVLREIAAPPGDTRRRDLGLVLLGGLTLLLLIAFGQDASLLQPLRLVLGLAYVLYVPGYCLVAALFPYSDDLDGPERIAASFALSFAVIPPIALLLDKLPWGIRLWPMVVSLGLFILACAAVAWYRCSTRPGQPAFASHAEKGLMCWWSIPSGRNQFLFGAMAIVVLAVAASAAAVALRPAQGKRTTEFYLLGPRGLAEDYPRDAVVGQPVTITAGIINHEGTAADYRIAVLDGGRQIGHAGPVRVEPGAPVEDEISFVPDTRGDNVNVSFRLYRNQGTTPYRSLRLWLKVKGAMSQY